MHSLDLPYGPSLSLFAGVLVFLRAEGTRVQSRVALVLPRARGPLLHALRWLSPLVCSTLPRVATLPSVCPPCDVRPVWGNCPAQFAAPEFAVDPLSWLLVHLACRFFLLTVYRLVCLFLVVCP